MSKKQISIKNIFTNGIVKENPVLRSALALCPALAVTTSAINGFGMGIATTGVLMFSNTAIAVLRKVIPDKVRIPAYITVIAATVTMMQMIIRAFAPTLDESLGIFLPLIASNCIVLGRAEAFARKSKIFPSMVDGLSMGIGNTIALVLIGSIREILGLGSWFGIVLNNGEIFENIQLFFLPPGGLLALAFLVALTNRIAVKKGKEPATLNCRSCPNSEICQPDIASNISDNGLAT